MDEKKAAEFWKAEKELRNILHLINTQLEVTQRVLSAQLPKLQELFLQFTQLGLELGYNVDSLSVKKFYDNIKNSELFQPKGSLVNDMKTEKAHGNAAAAGEKSAASAEMAPQATTLQ